MVQWVIPLMGVTSPPPFFLQHSLNTDSPISPLKIIKIVSTTTAPQRTMATAPTPTAAKGAFLQICQQLSFTGWGKGAFHLPRPSPVFQRSFLGFLDCNFISTILELKIKLMLSGVKYSTNIKFFRRNEAKWVFFLVRIQKKLDFCGFTFVQGKMFFFVGGRSIASALTTG